MKVAAPQRFLRRDRRRKLGSDRAYPAARAIGSSRLTEIRPAVVSARSATTAIVMTPLSSHRRGGGGLMPGDDPHHGLVRGPRDLRGGL
jgi:hypothetical protein